MIIKAAIKLADGSVYTAMRHNNCWDLIRKDHYPDYPHQDQIQESNRLRCINGHTQGFVTHTGEFVDRREAAIIANKYHQTIPLGLNPLMFQTNIEILYSEDLY